MSWQSDMYQLGISVCGGTTSHHVWHSCHSLCTTQPGSALGASDNHADTTQHHCTQASVQSSTVNIYPFLTNVPLNNVACWEGRGARGGMRRGGPGNRISEYKAISYCEWHVSIATRLSPDNSIDSNYIWIVSRHGDNQALLIWRLWTPSAKSTKLTSSCHPRNVTKRWM